VCSKDSMTNTFLAAASFLKADKHSSRTNERISGHSLRATGAQGLTRLGLDLWAVQLMGRWGTEVVKDYVRQAHVEVVAAQAARAAADLPLDAVIDTVVEKLRYLGLKFDGRSRPTSVHTRSIPPRSLLPHRRRILPTSSK
jgi:hypothetical protein